MIDSLSRRRTILRLKSTIPLRVDNGSIAATFTLAPNETADFLLEHIEKEHIEDRNLNEFVTKSLFDTVNYWKDWVARSLYCEKAAELCRICADACEACACECKKHHNKHCQECARIFSHYLAQMWKSVYYPP